MWSRPWALLVWTPHEAYRRLRSLRLKHQKSLLSTDNAAGSTKNSWSKPLVRRTRPLPPQYDQLTQVSARGYRRSSRALGYYKDEHTIYGQSIDGGRVLSGR